jgi:hypothetical protein
VAATGSWPGRSGGPAPALAGAVGGSQLGPAELAVLADVLAEGVASGVLPGGPAAVRAPLEALAVAAAAVAPAFGAPELSRLLGALGRCGVHHGPLLAAAAEALVSGPGLGGCTLGEAVELAGAYARAGHRWGPHRPGPHAACLVARWLAARWSRWGRQAS